MLVFSCNICYQQKIFNAYKFSYHDKYEFILLLRQGVCPYKLIGDW